MAASFRDLGGGGSCGGLCMTEFEFLENVLEKHGGESLVTKFFKGKGKATNAACEMTEEVSEVLKSLTEFLKIVQNVAKIPILTRLETQNLVFGP